MTLVMASNFSEGIAVMTSDTREVFKGYWFDTETKTYSVAEESACVISEEKNIKAEFLTDYVLLGAAGISDLCRYFLVELADLVSKEDDLEDCGETLTKLIRDARRKQDNPLFSFLDQKHGVTIILNGFTRDGRSGLVLFDAGPGEEVELLLTPVDSARWTMTVGDNYRHLGSDLVENISDNQDILSRAVTLHARIAQKEPVTISPECHYFMLLQDEKGLMSRYQGEYDTSVWFEQLSRISSK